MNKNREAATAHVDMPESYRSSETSGMLGGLQMESEPFRASFQSTLG